MVVRYPTIEKEEKSKQIKSRLYTHKVTTKTGNAAAELSSYSPYFSSYYFFSSHLLSQPPQSPPIYTFTINIANRHRLTSPLPLVYLFLDMRLLSPVLPLLLFVARFRFFQRHFQTLCLTPPPIHLNTSEMREAGDKSHGSSPPKSMSASREIGAKYRLEFTKK